MVDRDYSRRGILNLDDVANVVAERERALRKDLIGHFNRLLALKELQYGHEISELQRRNTNLYKQLFLVERRVLTLERSGGGKR